MPSIGDFLNSLAIKAGIKPDDETLKNVLSAPDLQKINIPDDLVSKMDGSLISLSAAKELHPELKKHYFGLAYKGLDAQLESVMDELGLDDDVKEAIRAEKSSPARAGVLAKKIAELEKSKAQSGNSKAEKDAIQKQIDDLHAQLRIEKQSKDDLKNQYETKIRGIHIDATMQKMLASYKTIYDDLPANAREIALKTLINQSLQDSDAELQLDENNNVVLKRKDGTNLFGENNTQLNPQQFIDKTFSQNKILKVTDPNPPGPGNTPPKGNVTEGGKTDNSLQVLRELNADALKAFESNKTF